MSFKFYDTVDQRPPTPPTPFDKLSVCKECHKPIDMRVRGSVKVTAHDRTFCSGVCADAWEANPDNAEAMALDQSPRTVRGRWEP